MLIDELFNCVEKNGHVCVGLDTCAEYVPVLERQKAGNDADAVLAFNKALIDATYDVCACYKLQIAYYEEMGLSGLHAYSDTLKYIRTKNCLAIADIKRGDIADTAVRYAKGHFSGDFEADFVTLSPYMGMDSVEPWLNEAHASGKGAFVLMRTSNRGMRDFQYLNVNDCSKKVYNMVGDNMAYLAAQNCGKSGYGMFGVVVGCTERDEAAEIRKNYPNLFFLIPGYGAQGGGAHDAVLLLRNGNGGVVNASRSIITAWRNADGAKEADLNFASTEARRAVIKMRDEIKEVL
ncbi:MAG: orotidine-5'-phosphate decarboxylase [Treponema sp.]|nr:orotidine-5'-phosphate decarboxylase [Treponema sp.]